jgi:hypothetical protein
MFWISTLTFFYFVSNMVAAYVSGNDHSGSGFLGYASAHKWSVPFAIPIGLSVGVGSATSALVALIIVVYLGKRPIPSYWAQTSTIVSGVLIGGAFGLLLGVGVAILLR